MGDFKNLIAYQKSYRLALDIFNISKMFPADEKYGLTSQVRKSSRSVCANLAEAYRRRKYKPHFLSKLTDCEAEKTETEIWLDFSKDCNHITIKMFNDLSARNTEVRKLIYFMINNPDKFC